MKKFLFALCSFLWLLPSISCAKVYWVGRNIALSPNTPNRTKMLSALGHSYLVIIPDNPAKLKQISPTYAKYEKYLGCNKRGIVIGAYPSKGTEAFGDLDGNLEAQINAVREQIPTQQFLCGTQSQKKKWNFASGLVKSKLSDEQFIKSLLDRTLDYMYSTKKTPVNYHAVRSVIDAISASNSRAQNCNSFAFSLLAYSDASHAPDLGATRVLPGNRNLLPQYLFFNGPVFQSAGYVPEVVKNDVAYRRRVNAARAFRDAFNNYHDPLVVY